MSSWTVYCFECADAAARDALLARFEARHPVAVPADARWVAGALDVGTVTVDAEYAWLDRSVYVAVDGAAMGAAGALFEATLDCWERAAVAAFDGDGTATDVTFVADTDAGGAGEVEASRFGGAAGMAGQDVLYGLAMLFGFRFRAYAATPPAAATADSADRLAGAFDAPADVVGDLDAFVDEMAAETDVAPTDDGLATLRDDPAEMSDRGTDAAPTATSGSSGTVQYRTNGADGASDERDTSP